MDPRFTVVTLTYPADLERVAATMLLVGWPSASPGRPWAGAWTTTAPPASRSRPTSSPGGLLFAALARDRVPV